MLVFCPQAVPSTARAAVHPTARERNVERINLGNSNRLRCLTSGDVCRPDRNGTALSATFADVATIKTIEVTTQSGEVLARGTFSGNATENGRFERSAALTADG